MSPSRSGITPAAIFRAYLEYLRNLAPQLLLMSFALLGVSFFQAAPSPSLRVAAGASIVICAVAAFLAFIANTDTLLDALVYDTRFDRALRRLRKTTDISSVWLLIVLTPRYMRRESRQAILVVVASIVGAVLPMMLFVFAYLNSTALLKAVSR
jgi:hypothetical protein